MSSTITLFLHLFIEISNESQRTERFFRYFSVHQNPLEDLLKHRFLGTIHCSISYTQDMCTNETIIYLTNNLISTYHVPDLYIYTIHGITNIESFTHFRDSMSQVLLYNLYRPREIK